MPFAAIIRAGRARHLHFSRILGAWLIRRLRSGALSQVDPACFKLSAHVQFATMNPGHRINGQMKQLSAFTLVEMMIVVAIISLLLAIAVPSWIKTRERAQRDICIENLLQLETAKQLWSLETGQVSEPDDADLVGPTLYLKTFPLCPAGGQYLTNPVGVPAECTIDGHEPEP